MKEPKVYRVYQGLQDGNPRYLKEASEYQVTLTFTKSAAYRCHSEDEARNLVAGLSQFWGNFVIEVSKS